MNREILFRAKKADTGEWIEGLPSYCSTDGTITKLETYAPDKFGMFTIDPDTLCQYTGLTDRNGRKIFENDIVEYRDCTTERYVVSWHDDKACFEYQQYGCSIMNFDELSGVEVEVVGSIVDNPELLEVQE